MHAIDLLTICYNYTLYIVIRTQSPCHLAPHVCEDGWGRVSYVI